MLQTISSVLDQLQKKGHIKSNNYRKGQHWLYRQYFYKGVEWINSNLTGLSLCTLNDRMQTQVNTFNECLKESE